MAHIFISYSRNDGNKHASTLESSLKGEKFNVWRDIRDLNAVQDFTADIETWNRGRFACCRVHHTRHQT